MSKKERNPETQNEASAGTSLADYVWVSLAFMVFLGILLFAVRSTCVDVGDQQNPAVGIIVDETLKFFGALMGGGFLVVVLFDAAYGFFAGRASEPAAEPSAPPDRPRA